MKNKILLIEDSLEMRENTAELLQLAGYEVQTATNGIEGLAQLQNIRPELILCDIMMPELDGFGVLRAVKNIPTLAFTPFVFVTAKSEKHDFREGMDLGADDYLVKPFSGDELLRVVATRLEKSKLLHEKLSYNNEELERLMLSAKDSLTSLMQSGKHEIKKIRKKETVYMEGDSGSHLFLVLSGKIKTYRTNPEGKEYITRIHQKDDFFGYFALISRCPRKESAVAMEDTEVVLIPKEDFQRSLLTNKELSLQFISFMTKTLDEAEHRMLKLAYDSARGRVAEALIFLFKKYNAKDGDAIPLSRDNVSTLAGISSESASRNLSDFRNEGLIETSPGSVVIFDVKRLEKIRC